MLRTSLIRTTALAFILTGAGLGVIPAEALGIGAGTGVGVTTGGAAIHGGTNVSTPGLNGTVGTSTNANGPSTNNPNDGTNTNSQIETRGADGSSLKGVGTIDNRTPVGRRRIGDSQVNGTGALRSDSVNGQSQLRRDNAASPTRSGLIDSSNGGVTSTTRSKTTVTTPTATVPRY